MEKPVCDYLKIRGAPIMPLLLILFAACLSGLACAEPALSPSIEADADYLLTTADLSSAQYGMAVEAVTPGGDRLIVRTTGAEFVFEPKAGTLRLRQRLGKPREAAVVTFPRNALKGLAVTRQSPGAVLLSSPMLALRINGDSLLMLKPSRPLKLSYALGFYPATSRQYLGNCLHLDEYGGVGSYLATGQARSGTGQDGLRISHDLAARQILWLSVAPPKPFDWSASLRDRVVWHWSMQTGYPSDEEIAQWSKYGNMLLQQSEVMLWKDWSLRFIPRNGLSEFERVNRTCAQHGMRNFVYTSPFYFLTGTGHEKEAMNSFEHFAESGFSPGDGRGVNWPIFLEQITKVMREYRPQGLYFDGIYDNVVRTYLISRKAREVVGDGGILEYHATGSPPGGGVYVPQIDAYYTFMLRGEGCQSLYTNQDYLRYFVSTYNISNSIGVLCDNNDYKLDAPFVNALLDDNIRLHLIPGWLTDYRKDTMEQAYWPALTPALKGRVDAACARRNAEAQRTWDALQRAARTGTESLKLAFAEDFRNPDLKAAAPPPPANGAVQMNPPAHPEFIALPDGWRGYFSANNAGTMAARDGALQIVGRENTCAYIERPLPDSVAAVQCKIRCGQYGGMSWGPGLMLRSDAGNYRINVREEGRIGVDRAYDQGLVEGYPADTWYWLRLRVVGPYLLYEVSRDGAQWKQLRVENSPVGANKRLLIGKIANNGSESEYAPVGPSGGCAIAEVRVFTQ